jgi:hypothetical protein
MPPTPASVGACGRRGIKGSKSPNARQYGPEDRCECARPRHLAPRGGRLTSCMARRTSGLMVAVSVLRSEGSIAWAAEGQRSSRATAFCGDLGR